ncbi:MULTISPECIES: photosynthetic complex assembly protein PuhC [unclassified Roseateles]|uniref:photosynthetic complex assembly protein PuhC n=1 Tax=unclassified Roseateles TaxID=2626991 RepID=UPI0006FF3DB7|nr:MULTISPECIES: photosynthetic complex assembly protein PuhC [unclassified Roseateles]KQW42035.1 photosynthetic complex assembly protein PuhC [Pelomonas sp. Root405]KRA67638.1 photosynthetic complex assembly protein PuhC [Pelomonas sp. Root662]
MSTSLQARLPVFPLTAMAALVLSCLVGVSAVRLSGQSAVQQADAATASSRQLRFEDRDDGGIAVLDAASGQLLDTAAPGTNGFLRSTMRGLVRERKRQGLGPELPFQLLGRADGRLTLLDPATGRRIDLESFGPTNSAVFARLLPFPQGVDHVAQR